MGHVWLIGMMGSGKTTVGAEVAERLGVSFIDADDEVAESSGRSIEDLFSEGEAAFRAIEHDVILAIAASKDRVVATGGGAVLDQDNVDAMRASGTTVLLFADAQTLQARLEGTSGRPLLTIGGDIATIARTRETVYATSADVVIDTVDKTIAGVVEEVIACVPM
jgi:shikimate kinase